MHRFSPDLVVISLPGVQSFIGAARSTADLRAGSEIVATLAGVAARSCKESGALMVFPDQLQDLSGLPNRVVALTTEESGPGEALAQRARAAVLEEWRGLLRKTFGNGDGGDVPETPGMPQVQWVCVRGDERDYPDQWREAGRLLAARRLVRDFEPVVEGGEVGWFGRELCTLSPQWPAEVRKPPGLRPHEDATLSAANWVKRRWGRLRPDENVQGFPSTSSIASAAYRKAVLGRAKEPAVAGCLSRLREAAAAVGARPEVKIAGLPDGDGPVERWFARSGGPWVYADRWDADSLARELDVEDPSPEDTRRFREVAAAGREAAANLAEAMDAEPSNHLAVLVADLDDMGRFLSGEPAVGGLRCEVRPDAHQAVSQKLREVAREHRSRLNGADLLGVPVYAGGDDLLAFVPASTALAAARQCHDVVAEAGSLPTTSTAVLFFHYAGSLQTAVSRVREMLDDAKDRVVGKHALAVGFVRRSGASAVSVQPWNGPDGRSGTDLFGVFSRKRALPLSPRLLTDLDRDGAELGTLAIRHEDLYRRELTRLVERHLNDKTGGDQARSVAVEIADALDHLGRAEAAPEAGEAGQAQRVSPRRPEPAARVAVFLRQEVR